MGRKLYVSIIIMGLIIFLIGEQTDAGTHDVKEYRIYDNIWHGVSKGTDPILDMTIHIPGGGEISWKINGKELDHVEYEYVYSKFPGSTPFLCIHAHEGDKEHLFYGIFSIHQEIPSYFQIRGVYEMKYPCQGGRKPGTCAKILDIDLHGPPLNDGK
jgi:hypothetical protein